MKSILNGISKFVNGRLFNTTLFLLLLIINLSKPLISSFVDYETISYTILSVYCLLALIFSNDGFQFIPTGIFGILIPTTSNMNFSTIPYGLVVFVFIYFVTITIFIITRKVKIYLGKMKWSLFTVIIVLMLVSFKIPDNAPSYIYYFLLILPGYLYLYLFYASSIKGDKRVDLAQVFICVGLLIFSQSLYYVFSTPIDQIIQQIIDGYSDVISWSQENIVAIVLNICIGMTYTIILDKPKNIWYQLSLMPQVVALILTVSRAGILLFLFMSIIYLVLFFIYRPSNKHFFIRFITLITIGLIILFSMRDIIDPLIGFFVKSLTGNDPFSGRWPLIEEAIELFKSSPIIGVGIFGVLDVFVKTVDGTKVYTYAFRSFHSFPFQTLACAGIIGLLAVIYNYLDMARILVYKLDKYKLGIIVIFIQATIHGLVDNVYLMIDYTILSFAILGVVEAYDRYRDEKGIIK